MLRVKVLRQDTEIVYGRSKSCCKYLMDVFRKKISMSPTSETFFVYPMKQKKLTKKLGRTNINILKDLQLFLKKVMVYN